MEREELEKALADIGILAKTALRYNAAGRRDVMQQVLEIATKAMWEAKQTP
jgi:hypothetical protein